MLFNRRRGMRQTVITDRSATQVRNECVDDYIHDCQKRLHALQNCDPADQKTCFQLVSVCAQLNLDGGLSYSPSTDQIESACAYLSEPQFCKWTERAERLMCMRGRSRGNACYQSELLLQNLIDHYFVELESGCKSGFIDECVKWLEVHPTAFLDCDSSLRSYLEWGHRWDWAASCLLHDALEKCLKEAERYRQSSELTEVQSISAEAAISLIDRLLR